jgi:cell pole-organizing protein PopZ
MTKQSEAEPSMDDILASIRKIIADHPAVAEQGAAPQPPALAETPPGTLSARLNEVFGGAPTPPRVWPQLPNGQLPNGSAARAAIDDDLGDLVAQGPARAVPAAKSPFDLPPPPSIMAPPPSRIPAAPLPPTRNAPSSSSADEIRPGADDARVVRPFPAPPLSASVPLSTGPSVTGERQPLPPRPTQPVVIAAMPAPQPKPASSPARPPEPPQSVPPGLELSSLSPPAPRAAQQTSGLDAAIGLATAGLSGLKPEVFNHRETVPSSPPVPPASPAPSVGPIADSSLPPEPRLSGIMGALTAGYSPAPPAAEHPVTPKSPVPPKQSGPEVIAAMPQTPPPVLAPVMAVAPSVLRTVSNAGVSAAVATDDVVAGAVASASIGPEVASAVLDGSTVTPKAGTGVVMNEPETVQPSSEAVVEKPFTLTLPKLSLDEPSLDSGAGAELAAATGEAFVPAAAAGDTSFDGGADAGAMAGLATEQPAAVETADRSATEAVAPPAVPQTALTTQGALSHGALSQGVLTQCALTQGTLEPIVTALPPDDFDDTAAELLRPMLRQWLDSNMPRIVEKALRRELAQPSGAAASSALADGTADPVSPVPPRD